MLSAERAAEIDWPTSASRNPSTNHARHIGNRSWTPIPICCLHGGIWSKSTGQPRTVRIRWVTPSAYLTGHTLESGEVDQVVFHHLPTWWLIGDGAVSERSPIREMRFFRWIPTVRRTAKSIASVFHRGVSRPEVVIRSRARLRCEQRPTSTGPTPAIVAIQTADRKWSIRMCETQECDIYIAIWHTKECDRRRNAADSCQYNQANMKLT